MRQVMQGRTFTPEWLAKIAKANQKLTEEQAREALRLWEAGVPQVEIARRFGVHRTTIYNLRKGLYYRELHEVTA